MSKRDVDLAFAGQLYFSDMKVGNRFHITDECPAETYIKIKKSWFTQKGARISFNAINILNGERFNFNNDQKIDRYYGGISDSGY